jgi:DNA end-binding protein Ku
MARPFWSGSISFGLVQIPVGVQSAEESSEHFSLTMLDAKDRSPIGYKHVNKVTGDEVPRERRVKGYEVAKDTYVVLTDDDFKRANVKKTETIDIQSFVDVHEIPVTRFEKPYYLVPTKKGAKAYALLRDALKKTGKVAVATVVLRQRQSIAAILPVDEALVLELLRYDDELRTPADAVGEAGIEDVKVTKPELEMAERLVEGMSGSFDTSAIHDTYHEDLLALIEERKKDPYAEPEPLPKKKADKKGEVVDIMALLKRSVDAQTEGTGKKAVAANDEESTGDEATDDETSKPARRAPSSPRRRTPAKKHARG